MAKKKRENKLGKNRGTIRLQAFSLIEALLNKPTNMKKLGKAFQDAFDEDPVLFYKLFIRPTAEKELVVEPGSGGDPLSVRIVFADGDGNEEKFE